MVRKIRIYFEGDAQLRPGFRQFLSEIADAARNKRCQFDLIATDGTPIQDFRDALKTHSGAWNVLLLDSDLGKAGLEGCDSDSIFWMVQIMESWFLADMYALESVFKDSSEAVVKGNPNVEEIPKADVLKRLNSAANGKYHKVKHGRRLLELIDPAKVRKAAPNCERLFRLILARLR
jgi:hypothetical protein